MINQKRLIIITGPSGVGKGTVVKEILRKDNNFWLSISATTRKPRIGEIDGKDYYFLSRERFTEMISKDLFLEWAEFAGNYYGTPKNYVEEKIEKDFLVILEIEVDGAKQIREKFPNNLSIFLLPPNKKELEKRIRSRATDNEASIKKRLKRSEFEIKMSQEFDYVLTNRDLKETVERVISVIKNLNS